MTARAFGTVRSGRSTATLDGVPVGGAHPVVVIGVINVSPESFYPPSIHRGEPAVRTAARAVADAGAPIVDIGAMSTAPYGAGAISEDDERERLGAAVTAVVGHVGVSVSVDTSRPGPLSAAIERGARVLNDVTGLADARVAALVAAHSVSVIVMASPATARAAGVDVGTDDPVGTVAACFEWSLRRARATGIPDDRIVLDPGIGFFLTEPSERAEWDVTVLAGLEALTTLGRPLAVGVSRKSFVGTVAGARRPEDRLAGSLAATALAVAAGADVVRTHDVTETRDAVRMAETIARVCRR
jgi:dihydropteroate synthase